MTVIRFRTFRNSDPPRLLRLFQQTRTGRAFACPDSVQALETGVFALPYFDPAGLIIAEEDGEPIGFIHAGFGFAPTLDRLDTSLGVICCVLVIPSQQRRNVGRELVQRAEAYLRSHGAKRLQAGMARHSDPFYFGLYGGARPSGFLTSDPAAQPFFEALGYRSDQKINVYQRDLRDRKDPMNFRLMALRRQTELLISDQPEHPTWWWFTRFANIESMRFRLTNKKTSEIIASVTVVGLDHYMKAWNERAIGLVDIFVEEKYRGQGYGQTLIVEAIRRLRTELITRAEIHIPQENVDAIKAVGASGFVQVDMGMTYTKDSDQPSASEPSGEAS